MPDFLDVLAQDTKATVASGYYQFARKARVRRASLKRAIMLCRSMPIIAEIKAASPSKGVIRTSLQPDKVASSMVAGGASAISVLTEPKHFGGSIEYLCRVRETVELPVLMKDIVVDSQQLIAASRAGSNAVLLIQALFDRGYCAESLRDTIEFSHANNLEVLLEVHDTAEFQRAVKTNADLIGINNRDLGTLNVDLNVTKSILSSNAETGKLVVSESGIYTADDVKFLRDCGADAFLVGSAIMTSIDLEAKVKDLVKAA